MESYEPERFLLVTIEEQDRVETREKNTLVRKIWIGDLAEYVSSL